MQHLISGNLHFLDQIERLLVKIDDQEYIQPVAHFYGSTVGQHVRHCLDHYLSFLDGLPEKKVDYNARARCADFELSTATAGAKIRDIREALTGLTELKSDVNILVELDCGSESAAPQHSTLGRELQFLVSHTVHHFAMIGGMCSHLGITLEVGFGVAPSTLRHREVALSE